LQDRELNWTEESQTRTKLNQIRTKMNCWIAKISEQTRNCPNQNQKRKVCEPKPIVEPNKKTKLHRVSELD